MEKNLKTTKRYIISMFNDINRVNNKLKFKCYTEGIAVYHLEIDNEEEFFELNICNNNITYYPEMTILELLEKEPTYISFRHFSINSKTTHDCEDIIEYCLDIDDKAECN